MTGQNNSIINLGDLVEPAKVLIEKISEAVGGIFRPVQIRRIAQAEADAEKIKALSKIELSQIEERAIQRSVIEEGAKQKNIEDITRKALTQIKDDAQPQHIEKDWLVDFFDKARLVSDDTMQNLWAKILAGEANNPGSFSKRTIHIVSSLDKNDASLFNDLANFVWIVDDEAVPLIFDTNGAMYKDNDIFFYGMTILASIGLVSFDPKTGFTRSNLDQQIKVVYQDSTYDVNLPKDSEDQLEVGGVIFTPVGKELFGICSPTKIVGFPEMVVEKWIKDGAKIVKKN